MEEVKTLNQWLRLYGYEWNEGQEEISKGEISRPEAVNAMNRLWNEGKIY